MFNTSSYDVTSPKLLRWARNLQEREGANFMTLNVRSILRFEIPTRIQIIYKGTIFKAHRSPSSYTGFILSFSKSEIYSNYFLFNCALRGEKRGRFFENSCKSSSCFENQVYKSCSKPHTHWNTLLEIVY